MKAVSILLALLVAAPGARAQDAGHYDEPFRPQFHFSPARNWMNDPNGLVYHDGEYHLFYQYNPFGNRWGHMSWGHAVSPDLVHWRELPVALAEEDGIMIFSGSAVVDYENTSGFGRDGEPPMVAMYTGHRDGHQAQHVAYSLDRGRTWTKYHDNPVLDLDMADFRDPKVFWYEPDERWVMVVALPTERKVHFYTSENLVEWTFRSAFGPAGSTDGIWECPDLFELPQLGERGGARWVLEVDLGDDGTPRGSSAQYFVGSFDGRTFTAEQSDSTRWVDYGADYYAAVSWNHSPGGRRIWLAWMNNWNYAQDIPTSPWRSSQSIPRSLTLDGSTLLQEPVESLAALRGRKVRVSDLTLTNASRALDRIAGAELELEATFDLGTASAAGLRVRVGEGEHTVVGIDAEAKSVFVDRSRSGTVDFNEDFATRHDGPVRAANGLVTLHLFVDRSSVEVFADGGRTVITDRIFPRLESVGVEVFAEGGTARLVELEAWPLESIWKQ